MTNKIRTRKTGKRLLLHWVDDKEFAVTVKVRPRTEPRLLKQSTIAIHFGHPGVKPARIQQVEP